MEVSTRNILKEQICKSGNWEYKDQDDLEYCMLRERSWKPFTMAEWLKDSPVWCKTGRALPCHMKTGTESSKGPHGRDRKLPSALYSMGQSDTQGY